MLAIGDVTFVVFWQMDPSDFIWRALMSVVVDFSILLMYIQIVYEYKPMCIRRLVKTILGLTVMLKGIFEKSQRQPLNAWYHLKVTKRRFDRRDI